MAIIVPMSDAPNASGAIIRTVFLMFVSLAVPQPVLEPIEVLFTQPARSKCGVVISVENHPAPVNWTVWVESHDFLSAYFAVSGQC